MHSRNQIFTFPPTSYGCIENGEMKKRWISKERQKLERIQINDDK